MQVDQTEFAHFFNFEQVEFRTSFSGTCIEASSVLPELSNMQVFLFVGCLLLCQACASLILYATICSKRSPPTKLYFGPLLQ